MKTFVSWQGNKSRYLKYIKLYLPTDYNTYIEPFVGSGALFLYLQPTTWIINDINKDLVNIWNTVKKHRYYIRNSFKEFSNVLNTMNNTQKLAYCRLLLEKMLKLQYTKRRAVYYILLKYCAYMGHIFIQNKYQISSLDIKFYSSNNVYFLSDKYQDNIVNVSKYLNNTNGSIQNVNYKLVLKNAGKDDFVFLDPPYVESHDYKFKYNNDQNINSDFLTDLLVEVKKLDNKGVKWLMTQADTKDVRQYFKEYNIIKFKVYRGHSKIITHELIIKNY
jgi:DNA adenine methylase